MHKRIVFTGCRELKVEEYAEEAELPPDEVLVEGLCSIISTGTENIVFNRQYAPGTHWDNWVRYPFYPGYSFVGRIGRMGTGVTELRIGQRVALRRGHATAHRARAQDCLPVPDGISDDEAVWFALGKIAYAGACAAGYRLGTRALIVGGGPIGQLSARWALAAGAGAVALVDPVPERLAHARRGGVHSTIARDLAGAETEVRAAFGGRLPDVVVDTTGAAPVFAACLNLCAPLGTLVLLGDTGTPHEQRLTSSLINNGLRVIGAHDMHHGDHAAVDAFWALASDKRLRLEGLITHRFTIADAAGAYELANTRRGETLGILFDLRHEK